MNTQDVVTTAGAVLDEQLKAIAAATKSGDAKALSNALRVGGIASEIVEKGAMIADNPEKYEQAAKDSDVKLIPAILQTTDERAKAERFLRFKSAFRAASQVRKVNSLMVKMSSAPAPRGRKSAHSVKSVE